MTKSGFLLQGARLILACGILFCAGHAAYAATVALPSGGTLSAQTRDSRTVFTLAGPDRPIPVSVFAVRDDVVVRNALVDGLEIVAEEGNMIIVRDTYQSNGDHPEFHCGTGTEEFLRVLVFDDTPRETLRLKTGSCLQNIELDGEQELGRDHSGIKWDTVSRKLIVTWFSDADGNQEQKIYTIQPDGSVQ